MEEINKQEPVPDLQLLITMKPNGEIQVSGPIGNLIICFGLLEMAKVNLLEHAKAQQSKIQIPQNNNRMVDFLKNKKD